VLEAEQYKRQLFATALADKVVRDQAYRQAVYDREKQRGDVALRDTLSMADSAQTIDGKVYVVGKDAAGNVVKEPLSAFLIRAMAKSDEIKNEIAMAVAKETAADGVVNRKLQAVAELDVALEAYRQAAESGAVDPAQINKLLADVMAALKPLVK